MKSLDVHWYRNSWQELPTTAKEEKEVSDAWHTYNTYIHPRLVILTASAYNWTLALRLPNRLATAETQSRALGWEPCQNAKNFLLAILGMPIKPCLTYPVNFVTLYRKCREWVPSFQMSDSRLLQQLIIEEGWKKNQCLVNTDYLDDLFILDLPTDSSNGFGLENMVETHACEESEKKERERKGKKMGRAGCVLSRPKHFSIHIWKANAAPHPHPPSSLTSLSGSHKSKSSWQDMSVI